MALGSVFRAFGIRSVTVRVVTTLLERLKLLGDLFVNFELVNLFGERALCKVIRIDFALEIVKLALVEFKALQGIVHVGVTKAATYANLRARRLGANTDRLLTRLGIL